MLLLVGTRRRSAFAFSQFRASRKYHHSFGRNSMNTWQELPENIKNNLREEVEKRDGVHCRTCGDIEDLTIDHIVPIRGGGPVCDIGNMQLLCRKCHDEKTYTVDIKYVSKPRVLIYNYHKVRHT